ncbi:putative protein-S-isoprenylcysteine methyltransferase [Longilinea arvoryzae]|uniref:Uncharacterized protein n=1 Tax=Longilinea arvoryzae TaxID=360412 RepID=A0A0S7BE27_9CHLR|nr:isoprenylcysteine carboxylmethyltransferase family protein [Longilinea arvoryzae]GAP13092.1 putative protein-S-isoprenylcysteine methyltransferase [Longilinea arvoryzae]
MPSSALILVTACGLYGVVHSLLASHTAKRLAEARWGAAARRWYRLGFSLLAGFLLLLPILWLAWKLPDRVIYRIPFPALILSGLIQLGAALALLAGLLQTGVMRFLGVGQALHPETAGPLIAGRRPQELVVDGVYRRVRHPLYTCGLVIIWLSPVMSWNLLALNVGMTGYILIGIYFEERKLLAEFGEAYAEYKRRTPALIPGMKRFHHRDAEDTEKK